MDNKYYYANQIKHVTFALLIVVQLFNFPSK